MSISESTWMERINNITRFLNLEKALVNPSLVFNKYLFWDEIDNNIPTLHKEFIHDGNPFLSKNYHKIKHFEKIINCNFPLGFDDYYSLKSRKNQLPHQSSFNLTTKTKIIVNHGMDSILENSISMHPYYGFPVIPGSAIKGVTRNYCEEYTNLDSKEVETIFGSQTSGGNIIFMDAWPSLESLSIKTKGLKLHYFYEIDVFTPHYQKYYQKESYPGDNQSPIPVHFLAVKKNITFEFVISIASHFDKQRLEYLEYARYLVSEALRTFGIGAKTGSSYGYFE